MLQVSMSIKTEFKVDLIIFRLFLLFPAYIKYRLRAGRVPLPTGGQPDVTIPDARRHFIAHLEGRQAAGANSSPYISFLAVMQD